MSMTLQRYTRFYADGYDLSSDTETFGELTWDYPVDMLAGLDWEIKGGLPDQAEVTIGKLNGIFNSTNPIHTIFSTAGSAHNVLIPVGEMAAPAMGSHVFAGQFEQLNYKAIEKKGIALVTIDWGNQSPGYLNYDVPWGRLLHAKGAETGANAANTNVDNAAATAAGGFLIYQIFAFGGTGSATISVDDSANGTTWAALSGATSGAIAHTAMPASGIIQLSKTATVRRYLRWQLALNTLTSCTFAAAFIRGR